MFFIPGIGFLGFVYFWKVISLGVIYSGYIGSNYGNRYVNNRVNNAVKEETDTPVVPEHEKAIISLLIDSHKLD